MEEDQEREAHTQAKGRAEEDKETADGFSFLER